MNTESINYAILLDARVAIAQLAELTNESMSFDKEIAKISAEAQMFSEKWGVPLATVVSLFKQLDTELASIGSKSALFGNMSGGWAQVTSSLKAANEEETSFSAGIDFIRVALGTLSAMLVFQVINAITTTFTNAINYANEYYQALYQIGVAQNILAESGISISSKQLLDTADQLTQKFGVFSDVQMKAAVAQAALLTQNFGLSGDQIKVVTESAAALAIQEGDVTKLQANIEQITRAITSSNAPAALSKLGVYITKAQVDAEALSLGLTDINGKLSDQGRITATLAVLQAHTAADAEKLSTFQNSTAGAGAVAKASWTDFLTSLGTLITPVLAQLQLFASYAIKGFIEVINEARPYLVSFFSFYMAALQTVEFAIAKHTLSVGELIKQFQIFMQQDIKSYMTGYAKSADEATSATNNLNQAINQIDTAKAESQLEDLAKSIQSIQDQMDKNTRNFNTKEANALSDFNTKISRDQQDYQISVANEVASYNTRRKEAEAKYRANEIDAEAKFQEKMRELREKYLFDLEDALRNRDARQVLRLQAQYKMDTDAATNNFNIQHANAARQYKEEQASLKANEDAKLAEMAAAEKLKEQRATEDYNTQRARDLASYTQQQADLQKSIDEKLRLFANQFAQQYNLGADGADKVYELLKKYYGPGGYLDGLYDYSYQSMIGRSQAALQALVTLVGQYQSILGAIAGGHSSGQMVGGNKVGSPPPSSIQKHATGGVDIVNAPTRTAYGALYGEAGPEMHVFLPLSTSTQSVASELSSSVGAGIGGKLSIDLNLSPDLEARVSQNTLNKAADIIVKVQRSK